MKPIEIHPLTITPRETGIDLIQCLHGQHPQYITITPEMVPVIIAALQRFNRERLINDCREVVS